MILVLPSSNRTDTWRTRLAGGGPTHLSSHARGPRPATSDKTNGSQALARPTASKRASSPPRRHHLPQVGRHRRPESKQQASRVRCLVALGAYRRRTALRPELLAAGPASNSTLLSIASARASFAICHS